LTLQVRPQVSVALPRVKALTEVPKVGVLLALVHVLPPFQESWTQILGEPDVLSTLASSRTVIPLIVEPPGIEKP